MFLEYSENITSWLLEFAIINSVLSNHTLLTQKQLFHRELSKKSFPVKCYPNVPWICWTLQHWRNTQRIFREYSGPAEYALKRTTVDSSSFYAVDALETVMKSFYVDDLLTSVESEEYSVDYIKRYRCTSQVGGFNLTKFVYKRRNVLLSKSDIHRREGVKDTDLVK